MMAQPDTHRDARLLLAAADLAVIDGTEALYAHLGRALVPDFADWVKLYVRQGTSVALASALHTNPDLTPMLYERYNLYPLQPSGLSGIAAVMRSNTAELIPEIPEALLPSLCHDQAHLELTRTLGLGSSLALPLNGKNEVIGAVYLAYGESGRCHTEADLTVLQDFLRRVGATLERLWSLEEGRRQETKLRREARKNRIEAVQYSRLFKQTPNPTVIWSKDGEFLDANNAYERFTGVNPQNFVHYNLLEDPQIDLEPIQRCLKGLPDPPPLLIYDPRSLNPDSRPFIARLFRTPIRGASGKVREFATMLQAVTDQSEKMEAFYRLEAENRGRNVVNILELKHLLLDAFSGFLSPRESSVLRLVADGYTNKRIARVLSISENTVKFYIHSLFNKLGVNSRAMAVSQAVQRGLL